MPIERFPNSSQTRILQAIFVPAETADRALASWLQTVDLDNVDWVEQRLIPHVYERIQSTGLAHPQIDVLKGVHRYWWFRNSRVLGQMPTVIRHLQEHGATKIMLLKGAALASFFYPNVALRPMHDIDLMLPPEQAETAINALLAIGFQVKDENACGDIANWCFQHYTRMGLSHPDYGEVDLHWEMLSSHNDTTLDDAVWQNAEQRTVADLTVYTPSREDLLLHVIDHGLSGVPLQTVWWVADAVMLLAANPTFNWDYFYQQANRVDRGLLASKALAWLADNLAVDIRGAEKAQRITAADHLYAAVRMRLRQHSTIDRIATVLTAFDRHRKLRQANPTPKTFADFLCQRWGEENPSALAGLAYRKYRHLA